MIAWFKVYLKSETYSTHLSQKELSATTEGPVFMVTHKSTQVYFAKKYCVPEWIHIIRSFLYGRRIIFFEKCFICISIPILVLPQMILCFFFFFFWLPFFACVWTPWTWLLFHIQVRKGNFAFYTFFCAVVLPGQKH